MLAMLTVRKVSWYILLLLLPSTSNFLILQTSQPLSSSQSLQAKQSTASITLHSILEILHHLSATMKTSSSIAAFGLMAVAAAAPADVVRRQAPAATSYAVDTASASGYPSSFGTSSGYAPTGAASAYIPMGTGVSCPSNGELVCSSDGSQFGLCNWGRVSFQPVAAGTQCKDGKIQFADNYPGAAAPSGVFPPAGIPYGSASAAPAATGA